MRASTATGRLYLEEPYRRECDATVTARQEAAVELDRTIFCPHSHDYGHPQTSDKGLLRFGGNSVRVKRVDLARDRVVHYVEGLPRPSKGVPVRCVLNFEMRHAIMRLHTAAHVLLAVAETQLGLHPRLIASRSPEIDAFAAYVYFEPESPAGRFADLEAEVNRALSAQRAVVAEWVPRSVAEARPDAARLRLARIPKVHDPLRFVRIEGLGESPCDGTLVANAREVGVVVVRDLRQMKAGRKLVLGLQDLPPPSPVGPKG